MIPPLLAYIYSYISLRVIKADEGGKKMFICFFNFVVVVVVTDK